MYIRLKTHKNNKYAYLTKNVRYKRRKNPIQKTLQYLGRVYILRKQFFLELTQEQLDSLEFQEALLSLISLELKNHNFRENEDNLILENIIVNLKNKTILSKQKPVTLAINEGFFNNYTLKQLIEFKPITDNKIREGKTLAKLLVSLGLKIKPEQFILLFQKLYKNLEE